MSGSELATLILESPHVVGQVADLLEAGTIAFPPTRTQIEQRVGTYDDKVIKAIRSAALMWADHGEVGRATFVMAVRAGLEVQSTTQSAAPACELVWTGKGATGPVRSTVPVILEMLAGARSRVVLLSYSVWLKQSKVNGVLDRLVELAAADVDLTWIVDAKYHNGHNVEEIERNWPAGTRRPTIYTWSDLDDDIAKLHAKVIVVDGRDALVTSANLTGHGLTSNLELGLRVRGKPAKQLSIHLDILARSGVFDTFDWPTSTSNASPL